MVFYYEDYSTRFEDVTRELMHFLELTPVGNAPDFIVNKKYGDYYSEEETQAIATLVKEFSTKQVWQHLAHYFKVASAKKKTDVIAVLRGTVVVVE